MQYIDEIVQDAIDVQMLMQKMLKEQEENQDTLCVSTDPVHNEKIHDEQSRAAPEDTVPGEVERARRLQT